LDKVTVPDRIRLVEGQFVAVLIPVRLQGS
jgi:hypothetical protein